MIPSFPKVELKNPQKPQIDALKLQTRGFPKADAEELAKGGTKVAELSALKLKNAANAAKDKIGASSDKTKIQLEHQTQKKQQSFSAASAMSKKYHDTAMRMINNTKG